MNTYAGGSLTSAEAAAMASKIIRGRHQRTTYSRITRSQIFAYHMRRLRCTFRNTKGDSPACQATDDLFQAVIKNCHLLEVVDHHQWNAIAFLLRLSRCHQHWISSPSSWSPEISNLPSCTIDSNFPSGEVDLFNQLRSLVRHLFGKYPLPGFWDLVWFQSGEINYQWMDWYVELSAGKGYRSLKGLPTSLSKKAYHMVSQALDQLQLPQALRWAQLRTEGISKSTTTVILNQHCATDFENDHIWLPLFRLLDCNSDQDQTTQICNYVYIRKHKCFDGTCYQIKGKTIKSLTRELEAFYQHHPEYLIQKNLVRRRTRRRSKILSWPRQSKYQEWWERDIYDGEEYSIGELCKSYQLISEGRKMNHCVGTYIRRCMNGESSIWSLRSYYDGTWKNLVTIEVNPAHNYIVQAQARYNEAPSEADWQRIMKWAHLNRLTLAL